MSFQWVTGTLSMVVAISLARILLNLVTVYRSRFQTKMEPMPFVWMSCIFYSLLQFSWAIQELDVLIKQWSLPLFLSLFILVILLFLSAALILPQQELTSEESFHEEFKNNGSSAIFVLGLYELCTVLINWIFWSASPLSWLGIVNLTLAALALSFLMVENRSWQWLITIIFVSLDYVTLSMA